MCLGEEKRAVAEAGKARGNGEGGRAGLVPVACSQVTPFSVAGSGGGEEKRRRSGTVERNGQQYCRRGPGDLRGADRKGLVGPPE